jgi:hypothetical protein
MFSIARDLTSALESLSYLLSQAAGLLVTQCGIGIVITSLMPHWVNQDRRGSGTDADSGARGT